MSIQCMTRVWERSSQKGSKLLILLALADHCDDSGVCWPGVERLAQKARISERQAQYHLRDLEEAGELYVNQQIGRTNTNRYLVTVGLAESEIAHTLTHHPELNKTTAEASGIVSEIARRKGAMGCTYNDKKGATHCAFNGGEKGAIQRRKGEVSRQKGAIQRTKKVQPIAPEPSLESSSEPSEKRGSANADRASGPEPAVEPKLEPERPLAPAQAMFEALAVVCAWDLGLLTESQRGQLNQTGARLRKLKGQSVTPADVLAFGDWWRGHDWRGKRGEFPRPDQVRSEWGRFQRWQKQRAEVDASQARAAAFRQADQARAATEAAADPDLALARKTWAEACAQLAGSMTRETFTSWIEPLQVLRPNGTFRLAAPTREVLEWVEHRLRPTVERALASVVGREVTVEFVRLEEPDEHGTPYATGETARKPA